MNRIVFVTILSCIFLSTAFLAQNSPQKPKTGPKPTATEPKPVAASGASTVVYAQKDNRTETDEEVARFLIDMTRQWLEANITHDPRILERILADDYQIMRPTGRFSTKSEEIARVKASNPSGKLESDHLDDAKVRVFGDVAVLYGWETFVVKCTDKVKTGTYFWSDVWLKRSGRWQAVAGIEPDPTHVSPLLPAESIPAQSASVESSVSARIPQAPATNATIFTVPVGDSLQVGATPAVALSQTGNLLVYVGRHSNGTRLYLQAVSGGQPRALGGTDGAANPFFSRDGHWVGFFSAGKLKKLLLDDTSSTPAVICDASGPRGASWGDDGRIVFAVVGRPELLRVSAEGGAPQPVTRPTDQEDFGHRWPQVLPGGKTALFAIDRGAGFDNARIAAVSLETGEIRPLIEGGTSPHYAAGHVVYARQDTLFAARFDVTSLKVTGPAAPVLSDVATNAFNGVAHFSIANSGSLAFISRDVPEGQRTLVWVDRQGTATPLAAAKRAYYEPRLSPDGAKLAFVVQKPIYEVWTYDLKAGQFTRLSEPGIDADLPTWSRDSREVTFAAKTSGVFSLFRTPADGSGPREPLLTSRFWAFPSSWSPDGRTLMFSRYYPPSGWDIWVLGPGSAARSWIRAVGHQGGATFSPDGRWIAYISTESGRSEVYLAPYPGPGDRRRVSSAGGGEPVWSRDGHELFYREGKKLMSVRVRTRPTFSNGPPTPMFEGPYALGNPGDPNYDVALDGKRFIMVHSEIEPGQLEICLLPDWVRQLPK